MFLKLYSKLFKFIILICIIIKFSNAQNLRVDLAFDEKISKNPVSGKILVFFHKNTLASIEGVNPFDPQPTFAMDVKDWKPGEFIEMNKNNSLSWKGDLDSLDGWYGVQAILDIDTLERSLYGKGNGVTYKNVVFIKRNEKSCPLTLLFNRAMPGKPKFKETQFIKEVKIKSELLTKFYGYPEYITAAVILPAGYFKDTTRIYPTVYVFPGWGATHYEVLNGDTQQKRYGMSGFGQDKIFVFVNHECKSGYHEFVNSENNGPRERTFFDELLPYIENNYRVDTRTQTRFLMGQSSGAWAGLWLLINNPEKFGGAFVTSPDPVDFRDFTGCNIYEKNANLFYDSFGKIKYLTKGISLKDFAGIDRIMGTGEQLYSFDAVFSKIGKDNQPEHLFDWETGKVNPIVAKHWEKYDLSKAVGGVKSKNKKMLDSKIHIYAAENDDFGLNAPVKLFKEALESTGMKGEVKLFEKGGHGGLWTDELRKQVHNQIDEVVNSLKINN